METIIYESLRDFKENYFVDFSIQSDSNMLQYLSMLKKKYNSHIDQRRALYEKHNTTTFEIIDTLDDLDSLLPYQSHYILKNDLLEGFNPKQYSSEDFIISPELLHECIDLGKHSEEESKMIYEKLKALFSLKKQQEIKDDEFYTITYNYYQILNFITEQIEIEKNILLRFRDLPKTESTENIGIPMDGRDLFHHIRYNDVGYFERTKILKEVTENYHPDLLTSLLKDLEFYLFIEKEEKEAGYNTDEIKQAIKELELKNLPVPTLGIIPDEFLSGKQKEMHKAHEKESGKKEPLSVDLESLLFPYEFFSLYEFQRSIIRKIKEVSPQEKEPVTDMDIPELKTSKTKSIALLHHTGILSYLRDKYPTLSDRQLAGFFEFLTREPITVRNQSSQFTKDKNALKYPIKNKKDIEDLERLLISFGMKERRIF